MKSIVVVITLYGKNKSLSSLKWKEALKTFCRSSSVRRRQSWEDWVFSFYVVPSNSLTKYTCISSFSEQLEGHWQLYNWCSRIFFPVNSLRLHLRENQHTRGEIPQSLCLCSYASWSHFDKTQIFLASFQCSLMRAHEITSNAFMIPTETVMCNIASVVYCFSNISGINVYSLCLYTTE